MSLGSARPPDVNPPCSVEHKSRSQTACRCFASRVLSHLPALLRLTCRLRSALVPDQQRAGAPHGPHSPGPLSAVLQGKALASLTQVLQL